MRRKVMIMLFILSMTVFSLIGCNSSGQNEQAEEEKVTEGSVTNEDEEPEIDDITTESRLSDEVLATLPVDEGSVRDVSVDEQAEGEIPLIEAEELALSKAGEGEIVEAVSSYYDDIPVYKIIILSSTKKYIVHVGREDSQIHGYKEISIH